MGEREFTWQDTRYVLGYFGKKINNTRKGYFSHVKELFYYWLVRELGISGTHLAKRLGMRQSGVVYAVNKGEKAAKEKDYQLVV